MNYFEWSPNNTYGNRFFEGIVATYIDNMTEIGGDGDGSDNWEYVKSIDSEGTVDPATNYPAFNFASTYATNAVLEENLASGWYVPTLAELVAISLNRELVHTALTKCADDEIYDNFLAPPGYNTGIICSSFWSSSQDSSINSRAWSINISIYKIYQREKDYRELVCCVRAF